MSDLPPDPVGGVDSAAVDHIRAFLDAEHRAVVAVGTERDPARLQAALDEARRFLADGMELRIGRWDDEVDEEWFREQAEQLEDNVPRKLFLVRAYRHPELGTLHRCYASTDRIKGRSYFQAFYVAGTAGGLRIVSKYTLDRGHTGWDWSDGVRVKDPGEQVGIVRFLPPVDPRDLADYESGEALF